MTESTLRNRGFRTGSEEARAASERPQFSEMGYFKLEDGGQAYVQFITDIWEWATVDMHNVVPTKARPADYQGENWPEKVSPICRHTKMGDGMPMFDDCYVCEHVTDPKKPGKPFPKTSRIWAIGVLRDEVLGNGDESQGGPPRLGKRIGFRDRKVEVAKRGPDGKPTSEKVLRPEVILFTMGWKNFFSALEGTAQVNDGTIVNLNFAIRRTGEGLKTTYQITNLGKTSRDFNTPKACEPFGIKVDPTKTDAEGHPLKEYPPEYDMYQIIEDRASSDYYGRWLDPNGSTGSSSAPSKPSNDTTSTVELEEMQKRIMGYSDEEGSEESFETSGTAEVTTEFE